MSGWPKPDEQVDWSDVAANEDELVQVQYEDGEWSRELAPCWATAVLVGAYRITKRGVWKPVRLRRSKAQRRADERRARAWARVEREAFREGQRRAQGCV